VEIFCRRQYTVRANQTLDLKYQRIERREVDKTEAAKEQPTWEQAIRGAVFRGEKPADEVRRTPTHNRRNYMEMIGIIRPPSIENRSDRTGTEFTYESPLTN
jgi:hypothetical protein